jgi:hypothetical protein
MFLPFYVYCIYNQRRTGNAGIEATSGGPKDNIDWSEYASTLVKALGASNERINSREDFNALIRSQIFITS